MKIFNKRAKFNYLLERDKIEAGIVLTGGEAKAVRTGHADLTGSQVRFLNSEAWLINAKIPVSGAQNYDPSRTRKLLLHRHEIVSLETKMKQRRLTLVPILLYTTGRLVKLKLALAKSKRKFEKKEAIKKKDIEREIAQQFKKTVSV